jgi:hypothetical protein
MIFIISLAKPPNGLRITRQGTGRKNAAVDYLTCVDKLKASKKPAGRVHALLGGVYS